MTGTTTSSRSTGVGTGTGTAGSGGSVAAQAKDAVSTATSKAKAQGTDLTHMAHEQVDAATHRLTERADERKDVLAEQARSLQSKLEQFATSIADDQPKLGEAASEVVSRVGRLVDYVEQTPVEDMTKELRDKARTHPVLFAAGMFGIGFALTRALKPVDKAALQSTSTGGARQLGAGSTQPLPMSSSVDGGMY